MNEWLWLIFAIILEVLGTTCLKISHGLEKVTPSILTFVFYAFSFTCLAIALKKFEVGIAYAIWSGLGTALIAVIGIVYFSESLTFLKIFSIILIILGVVGLNLVRGAH